MKKLILVLTVLFLTACGSETKTVEVEKIVEVPVVVEPEKPKGGIAITIDDGAALSSLVTYIDIFEKYGAVGTYYVSHHNHSMDEHLLTLQDVYGWEIGNHTQNHRNAIEYSESKGEFVWLQDEVLYLQAKLGDAGLNVTTFAYPFGLYTRETNEVLKPYFKNIRGFGGTKQGDYSEGFYNDSYFYFGVSVDSAWVYHDELKMAMDRALENGETLVVGAHVIGEWTSAYHITLDDLEFILDYASTIGLEFKTMSEL